MNQPHLNTWISSLWAPVTWCVAAMALIVAAVPGWDVLLQFDTAAFGAGEWWRVLSGHVTHWNGDHLFWDLSVFVVLGTMCERRSRQGFVACMLLTAIAVSGYVMWFLPELDTYRGLSGIDTGLFALVGTYFFVDACRDGNRTVQWLIGLVALSLLVKTGFEFATGATMFVDHSAAAFVPLPMAHVIGAVIGVATGLFGNQTKLPCHVVRRAQCA
ncbi:MAG: rhombosortase [Pirellulales bacterium]|nr:rhombosortase [Pirellulales bacterium]